MFMPIMNFAKSMGTLLACGMLFTSVMAACGDDEP